MKRHFILCILVLSLAQAQNVGIGTAVPARKLHIVGDMRLTTLVPSSSPYDNTSQLLIRLSNGDVSGINFTGSSSQVLLGNGIFGTSPGLDRDWYRSGTSSIPTSITNNIYTYGSVAIGTSTNPPAGRLEIYGTDGTSLMAFPGEFRLIYRTTTAAPQYGFFIAPTNPNSFFLTTTEGGYRQTLYFGDGSANRNIFGISTWETTPGTWEARLVVNQNGNTGIGTNNPQGPLHIATYMDAGPNSPADASALVIGNYGGVHLEIDNNEIHAMDGTNGSVLFLNSNQGDVVLVVDNSGGRVGIGTLPSYLLHVNGTAAKPGGGSWTNASDIRLKKDISPYRDGLNEIMKINPIRYKYNGKAGLPSDKEYVGVVAQELQKIAPYMVGQFTYENTDTGEKETYLDVDNSAMTYMLVNAVKELARENEKLKRENLELTRQMQAQKERLQRIEEIVFMKASKK